MKRLSLLFVIIFLLTGCEFGKYNLKNFHNLSGPAFKTKRAIQLNLISFDQFKVSNYIDKTDDTYKEITSPPGINKKIYINFKRLHNELADNKTIKEIITKNCLPDISVSDDSQPKAVAAIAVAITPLLIAGGKMAFNYYMDQKVKELEKIKKGGQDLYSGSAIVTADQFAQCKCAILTRTNTDGKEGSSPKIGLIAIVKINKYPENSDIKKALTIQPLYIRAYNSAAYTKKIGEKETGAISASIGFAMKTISKPDSKTNLRAISKIGETVVTVTDIQLKRKQDTLTDEVIYPKSDMMPFPPKEASPISITMSVKETGDVGFDFDQAKAEVEALKSALGPAVESSLTELLKQIGK